MSDNSLAALLSDTFRSLWRISKCSLSPADRGKAMSAELRLNALSFNRVPNPVNILGYKVSYFGLREIRGLFDEIFVRDSYQSTVKNERPFIVDCGSNIGMSILYFKKMFPDARIIGFEPDPLTYEMLATNIRENGLADVTVYNCALSNENGSAELFRDPIHAGSLVTSLQRERCQGEAIVVAKRTLSDFISESIDLLKLDVEGSEYDILSELAETGKIFLVNEILLEYHHHITPDADHLANLLKIFEDNGFGYHIQARPPRLVARNVFQDIAIYAYRKAPD